MRICWWSPFQIHEELFGPGAGLSGGGRSFLLGGQREALEAQGVKQIAVPNRKTKSAARRQKQKEKWFKEWAKRWRTGLRRPDQCTQETARVEPLALSRGQDGIEKMGWPRCDRRQLDQHRPGAGDAGGRGMTNRHPSTKLVRSVILSLFTRLPKGNAPLHRCFFVTVTAVLRAVHFAPESS